MFRLFAKQVANMTTATVASAGVANVAYTVGSSAYDYSSNKYDEFKNSSTLFKPLTQKEREEYTQLTSTQFSY